MHSLVKNLNESFKRMQLFDEQTLEGVIQVVRKSRPTSDGIAQTSPTLIQRDMELMVQDIHAIEDQDETGVFTPKPKENRKKRKERTTVSAEAEKVKRRRRRNGLAGNMHGRT